MFLTFQTSEQFNQVSLIIGFIIIIINGKYKKSILF